MVEGGYESFEHTSDVGLRVWGRDLRELFEQAAEGLIDLLIDCDSVRVQRTLSISVRGEDPEDLLYAWLDEILYAFGVHQFAPASAHVGTLEGGRLTGELRGEEFDPTRHELRHGIKAVTYHDLAVQKKGDLYEVRIVFDV